MKKKTHFINMIVVLLLFLAACSSNEEPTASKKETEKQEKVLNVDVEKQIEQLKENLPSEYEISHIDSYFLTGNQIPEIVEVISEIVPNLEAKKVKISTYQYSPSEERWETIYEKELEDLYSDLEIIDNGQIMGDEREQVALGKWEGNGGFLSFFVLGSKDKKSISMILDQWDESFSNGDVTFQEKHLVVSENNQAASTYQWTNNQLMESSNKIAQKDSSQSESDGFEIISINDLPSIGTPEEEFIEKFGDKVLPNKDPSETAHKFALGENKDENFASIKIDDLSGNHGTVSSIRIYEDDSKEYLYENIKNFLPSDAKLIKKKDGLGRYTLYYSSEKLKELTGFEHVVCFLNDSNSHILMYETLDF